MVIEKQNRVPLEEIWSSRSSQISQVIGQDSFFRHCKQQNKIHATISRRILCHRGGWSVHRLIDTSLASQAQLGWIIGMLEHIAGMPEKQ